jgi:benzoyl-CoA reductase subunit D
MEAAGERVHVTAGIDAGSSAIKAAVVCSRAGHDGQVLVTVHERIRRRNPDEVARTVFDEACARAGLGVRDLVYVASTGDGEALPMRTGHFYGMTTHARGALHLCPEARAVLDAGALHARAIRMDGRGKVLEHRMTSQCASGSGQFLENIARYLGVPLDDVGALSSESVSPEVVSSICAVLAETDVINMVSRGIGTADILKGIHVSIAGRLARLLRAIRAEGVVLVTGGLAHDVGLAKALGEALDGGGKKRAEEPASPLVARTHGLAMYAGAIGAALLGAWRHDQLERRGRLQARA